MGSTATFLVASFRLPATVPEPPPMKLIFVPHRLFIKLTLQRAKGCGRPRTSEQVFPEAMSQSRTAECGGLGPGKGPGGHRVESCPAGGVPGGRVPGGCPAPPAPSAAGSAPPGLWPRSWCTSWPGGASHSCSASCLEGAWGWASWAWQRRRSPAAAATAPWCPWGPSWSCLRPCAGDKGPEANAA